MTGTCNSVAPSWRYFKTVLPNVAKVEAGARLIYSSARSEFQPNVHGPGGKYYKLLLEFMSAMRKGTENESVNVSAESSNSGVRCDESASRSPMLSEKAGSFRSR